MIDEKRIKAEAKKFADSAPVFDVNDAGEVEKAFKTGINWFCEAVWHSDEETPQPFGYILVNPKHHSPQVKHTRRDLDLGDFDRELQWEQYCSYVNDNFMWCYLEDILPQKREVMSWRNK